MRVVDPAVGDRDRDLGASGGDVPGLGRVDVGVVGAGEARGDGVEVAEGLARVVEAGLLEDQRVVGDAVEMQEVVGLREADLGAALEGPAAARTPAPGSSSRPRCARAAAARRGSRPARREPPPARRGRRRAGSARPALPARIARGSILGCGGSREPECRDRPGDERSGNCPSPAHRLRLPGARGELAASRKSPRRPSRSGR